MSTTLYWRANAVPADIARALTTLTEHYPLHPGDGAPQLTFTSGAPDGSVTVSRTDRSVQIEYGTLSDALRGIGAALAGIPEPGAALSESRPFATFGIMLDCSRNAVMKVEHVKRWLRCLSLLGYNMAMLYTEDTYRLPDEPFFGLLRGAYSREELTEIDDYAARLGIEMIGCIQTLGHLEQVLKWSAYDKIKDTDRELLVGASASYTLIQKMIANFADCFRSRRLHLGMDETWSLGRGRFLDLNGRQPGRDILLRHLTKVCRICDQFGLRPMIWSDMLFDDGNSEAEQEADAGQSLAENLDLVYWEYAGESEAYYRAGIERHRALGSEPLMGSAVWTWLRLWYGRADTERYASRCIRACAEAGLKEIFFTMWGDDGGYCEFDSALAGLAFAAAQAYGEQEPSIRRRYRAVCGIGYEETLLSSGLEFPPENVSDPWSTDGFAAALLWDDPLIGMHWLSVRARHPGHWPNALDHYRTLAAALDAHRQTTEPVDLGHAAALANLLAAKLEFRSHLEEAYTERDPGRLQSLVAQVPRLVALIEEVERTFRRQWHRRNKPFGFEVIQIRLGGLRQRFLEAGRAVRDLLEGKCDSIPQLEEGLSLPEETLGSLYASNRYRSSATPSTIL